MEEQIRMEEFIKQSMKEVSECQAHVLNGMLKANFIACSHKEKSITMEFPVQQWQANRANFMHGGALSSAIDMSMAAIARALAESNFTPTISLEVKFIRPIQIGDTIEIRTKATAAGKTISQFTSEVYSKTSGKLAATAAAVYYNIDITKR